MNYSRLISSLWEENYREPLGKYEVMMFLFILNEHLLQGEKGQVAIPTLKMEVALTTTRKTLIYRPERGLPFPVPFRNLDPRGKALVKITKGRNIGIGEFVCGFRPENTLFYPLPESELAASVIIETAGGED